MNECGHEEEEDGRKGTKGKFFSYGLRGFSRIGFLDFSARSDNNQTPLSAKFRVHP
jgi:hypothetical protein